MRPLLAALLAMLSAPIAGSAMAQARTPDVLRVAANDANGQPFVLYDEKMRLRGGLARDIMDHLSARLGLKPVYINLPRARVEPWLREGRVDAACFLAPDWVREPKRLRWSPILFHIRQVIVSPPDSAPVTGPRSLYGKRVGTLLNYHYPELAPYFADRRVLRADAPSFASNIAKLERGRIDAFLNDDLASLFAVENGGLPADIRIDALWAPENPVYCAFSPEFARRSQQWRPVLQEAVDAGRMQRWISAYTGGRRVAGSEKKP
ncbi:substrate-binding periplasmic protein [Arenimonas sp.]|uniref:substrate-binding periplasmic protein n=1 Tax=Arenimonas sp. TaxID=1872635 RepID=UPI0039E42B64